jgi:hypothetical protein
MMYVDDDDDNDKGPTIRIHHDYRHSKSNSLASISVSDGTQWKVMLLQSMFREEFDLAEYKKLRAEGYEFIGISSYQQFPHRIENEIDYPQCQRAFEESHPDIMRDLIGWCGCSRTLESGEFVDWPNVQPVLRFSESDYVCDQFLWYRPPPLPRSIPYEYDFVYSCPSGDWNRRCRNFCGVAQALIHRMITVHHLRVFIAGRVGSELGNVLEPLVGHGLECAPFLPHNEFLATIERSRALFVPNQSDASPRVLGEALSYNRPVFVNQHIYGGYHYVNDKTGMFFDGLSSRWEQGNERQRNEMLSDFDRSLSTFMTRLHANQYVDARTTFMSRYGEKAGRRLYRYIRHQLEKNRGRSPLALTSITVVPAKTDVVNVVVDMCKEMVSTSSSSTSSSTVKIVAIVLMIVVAILLFVWFVYIVRDCCDNDDNE